MTCSYRACGKSRKTNPGLSVYGFPVKDEERCKRWIINSGNCLDIPLKKYEIKGVCEDHFIPEDFVNETKHRLISSAVPKHYTDPLGLVRKKERGLVFEEDETSDKSNSTQVKSLSEKLQKCIEEMTMDKNKSRPVLSSREELKKDIIAKYDECYIEPPTLMLRRDLFQRNDCKLQLLNKKDKQTKCYMRKMYKRGDPEGSANRLKWLEEILKKRALNKEKNVSYYINVNDLLASFEILELSDFTDLEFGWHNRKNKENKNVKCYSRKSNNVHRFPSQNAWSEDTNVNDPLSLATGATVKHEEENDVLLKSDTMSSPPNIWKLEKVEDENIPDMLLSSEYEFMNGEVKDEGISECQFQWSEEEGDKSCIRLVDISKLQPKRFKEESKTIYTPRSYKNVTRRQRLGTGIKNLMRSSETEKFIYIINRNRLQIRKLRNKLRKYHKELQKLRRNQASKQN